MGAAVLSEPDRPGTHALVEKEAGTGTGDCAVIGIRQIRRTSATVVAREDVAWARWEGLRLRG